MRSTTGRSSTKGNSAHANTEENRLVQKETGPKSPSTPHPFAHDYLYDHGLIPGNGVTPGTRVMLDMEDGCRIWLEMVDCELDEVEIGMPVELTFRLLHDKGGYRFYSWRARPARG